MKFTNLLDGVIADGPKVKLLRYLIATQLELTGRQLAKAAKMHHRTCHRALQELATFGIVLMHRSGKAISYKINARNRVVEKMLNPLFLAEGRVLAEALQEIIRRTRVSVISAVIFGSVAHAAERATSDVDVMFLVRNKSQQDRLSESLQKQEYDFILTCGNRLSPVVFTLFEFRRRLKNKDRFIQNIAQNGKTAYGLTLQEALL